MFNHLKTKETTYSFFLIKEIKITSILQFFSNYLTFVSIGIKPSYMHNNETKFRIFWYTQPFFNIGWFDPNTHIFEYCLLYKLN